MSGSSDYLFFNGYNTKGQQGLWISDGNGGDGTHEIIGIVGAYAGGIDPSNITVFNGEVLFAGVDASGRGGLWTSDGFAGGTKELAGTSGLDPSDLTVFGNEVLFFGTDGSGQRGLWETDGTAAGTKEIEAGVNGSGLTVLDNGAWFSGVDGGLWVASTAGATEVIPGTAGTPLGTAVFGSATYTLTAPPGGLQPYGLDALNGNLLFGGSYQYTYTQSGVTSTATTTGLFEISGSTLQLLNPIEPAGIYQPTHLGAVFWAPGPIFNFTPAGWVNDGFTRVTARYGPPTARPRTHWRSAARSMRRKPSTRPTSWPPRVTCCSTAPGLATPGICIWRFTTRRWPMGRPLSCSISTTRPTSPRASSCRMSCSLERWPADRVSASILRT